MIENNFISYDDYISKKEIRDFVDKFSSLDEPSLKSKIQELGKDFFIKKASSPKEVKRIQLNSQENKEVKNKIDKVNRVLENLYSEQVVKAKKIESLDENIKNIKLILQFQCLDAQGEKITLSMQGNHIHDLIQTYYNNKKLLPPPHLLAVMLKRNVDGQDVDCLEVDVFKNESEETIKKFISILSIPGKSKQILATLSPEDLIKMANLATYFQIVPLETECNDAFIAKLKDFDFKKIDQLYLTIAEKVLLPNERLEQTLQLIWLEKGFENLKNIIKNKDPSNELIKGLSYILSSPIAKMKKSDVFRSKIEELLIGDNNESLLEYLVTYFSKEELIRLNKEFLKSKPNDRYKSLFDKTLKLWDARAKEVQKSVHNILQQHPVDFRKFDKIAHAIAHFDPPLAFQLIPKIPNENEMVKGRIINDFAENYIKTENYDLLGKLCPHILWGFKETMEELLATKSHQGQQILQFIEKLPPNIKDQALRIFIDFFESKASKSVNEKEFLKIAKDKLKEINNSLAKPWSSEKETFSWLSSFFKH